MIFLSVYSVGPLQQLEQLSLIVLFLSYVYSNFVLKFCPCPLRIQNGGFLSIVLRALQNLLSLKSQVQYANIIKGKQNQVKYVYLIKITNSLYYDSSVLV